MTYQDLIEPTAYQTRILIKVRYAPQTLTARESRDYTRLCERVAEYLSDAIAQQPFGVCCLDGRRIPLWVDIIAPHEDGFWAYGLLRVNRRRVDQLDNLYITRAT